MKNKKLCDPVANICSLLEPENFKCASVRVTKCEGESNIIKTQFPELTEAPNYSFLPVNLSTFHSIETVGGPIFSRPRPLPPNKLEEAKKEFDSLLALKIIRPSSSPWSSPLHMVKKADGSWRPCGDYRKINSITVPDRYSIPNMNNIHHKLRGATVFSTIDLVKAYHFIPMKEEDIAKTSICTPFGNFEYLRMPFGLRNSSSTFQRFIDTLFRDIPFVLTYIDDILIFSKNLEEHHHHFSIVCQKLSEAGLKVNSKKCSLFQPSVSFLGYEVNSRGIKPLADRVRALNELPVPTDSKVLQRYLGMFGFYQKCIPNFANKAKPLRDLLRQPKFSWTELHNISFNTLKQAVSEATELSFPIPNAPLTITADASSAAIGACLHQVVDGESKPLSFFSRKLSERESRYSTFDRELLAVFDSIKKWKYFVSGSTLTVFTDHKPLVGAILNPKDRHSERQERQISFILEHLSDIQHISGKNNVVADTLSRSINTISTHNTITDNSINITDTSNTTVNANNNNTNFVDLIEISKEQLNCNEDISNYKKFPLGDQSLLCEVSRPHPRPFIPTVLRTRIFHSFHSLSHPGWKATCRLIGSRYFWPSLKTDIKNLCSTCGPCQSSKVCRHVKKPFGDLPCPTKRFSNVHLDIVGPLETSNSEFQMPKYLLTMIDSHTRWLEAIPIREITADVICKCFLFNWVARYGPPLYIITDKGSQFCSELINNLSRFLGVHQIRTSSYNPKANGLVERCHRSLKASLIARGESWIEQLPFVLLGLRMHPQEDGSSPYSRLTGEQPMMPKVLTEDFNIDLLNQTDFTYNIPRTRVREVYQPKELMTCDFVWLRLDRVRRPLEAPYQGPFKVIQRTASTMTILVRGKATTVSIERVKPAKLPKSPTNLPEGTVTDEMSETTSEICQSLKNEEEKSDEVTRSGRRVRFRSNDDYFYY